MKILDCAAKYNKRLLPLSAALPVLAALVMSQPVRAAPVVAISPASGAVGTVLTVSGTVFDSYKEDKIYIFFDDIEIPGSPVVIDSAGTFSIDFHVPGGTGTGRHWIEARSDITSTSMLARSFFIVEEARIELDVADGPVGTRVTVSGSGFYAGRTVTFDFYNIVGEKSGSVLASPVGIFSYQFNIPYSTAGKHKITATNAEGDLAETEFETLPAVGLSLSSAGPGELLTVSGTGFGYKTEVEVNFGIYRVALARTDEYGNFDVSFNVPEVKPDIYDVKVLDEDRNMDTARLITTAGAKIDSTEGAVGTTVTVRGSGFIVGGTVTVDYDNLRVATAIADNDGAFITAFNVPASRGGNHAITVSDGETTKQFAYVLESDAPPAPVLKLPASQSETGSLPYFDWEDVTDPSQPVTYTLQVASDSNFNPVILTREALADSEYTVAEDEMLPALAGDAQYYWRVKAIDSAGNESEWSATQLLYVRPPATPDLLLPIPESRIEMPLLFKWQPVTSLNPPVTYHLQVAADLNFTSTLLENEGLVPADYTLMEDKELTGTKKGAPYYWRIKAVDGFGNESDWSAPQAFYTGSSFSMPVWLVFLLVAIGVAGVGYLAFRLGRRTAFSGPG